MKVIVNHWMHGRLPAPWTRLAAPRPNPYQERPGTHREFWDVVLTHRGALNYICRGTVDPALALAKMILSFTLLWCANLKNFASEKGVICESSL